MAPSSLSYGTATWNLERGQGIKTMLATVHRPVHFEKGSRGSNVREGSLARISRGLWVLPHLVQTEKTLKKLPGEHILTCWGHRVLTSHYPWRPKVQGAMSCVLCGRVWAAVWDRPVLHAFPGQGCPSAPLEQVWARERGRTRIPSESLRRPWQKKMRHTVEFLGLRRGRGKFSSSLFWR